MEKKKEKEKKLHLYVDHRAVAAGKKGQIQMLSCNLASGRGLAGRPSIANFKFSLHSLFKRNVLHMLQLDL